MASTAGRRRKPGLAGACRCGFPGVVVLLASACTVPVATNLDESDANRVVVALDAHGLAAEKTPEIGNERKWRVQVAHDDSIAATTVLAAEGLPLKPSPGVLEALGESSLVPSRATEHARMLAGTASELERTLGGVDGVVSARVHLAVPAPDRLSPEPEPEPRRATASVLLRYRGKRPPLSEDDVRRLLAGAVTGLAPSDIAVVATPSAGRMVKNGDALSRFGPITVTRASLSWLRLSLGGVAVVNIVLAVLLLTLWFRNRRPRGSRA